MPREPLAAILRVRRLALDQATRELAECLRVETATGRAVAAVEQAIAQEQKAASSLAGDDLVVEMFGAWLKRARQDLRAAVDARERAEAETARARAVVAAARAAVAAIESELARKAAEQDAAAARREQQVLDEVAQRRRR